MTLRQSYEFALIECNKLKAPSILLEDFIYLFNKAIQQYINGVYNRAEYNQQSSDDLGFLQTTTIIKVGKISPRQEFNDTIWELELPKDYLHLLNCMAEFIGSDSKSRCGDDSLKTITSPCQRLTADLYPGILNNYYMRPSHKKPYYYIINHNTENIPVTNPNMDNEIETGSYSPTFMGNTTELDEFGDPIDPKKSRFYALKPEGDRTSNQSTVKIDIHSGNSQWTLSQIYVTYLKSPMYVSMTQEQVLDIVDNTPVLEFPDYICYEIINIYVRLFLENASDPRLQTNVPINQTIAVPGNK